MPGEIDLINLENTSAIIMIIGYIIFYASAVQAERVELEGQGITNPAPSTNKLTPAWRALFSFHWFPAKGR